MPEEHVLAYHNTGTPLHIGGSTVKMELSSCPVCSIVRYLAKDRKGAPQAQQAHQPASLHVATTRLATMSTLMDAMRREVRGLDDG